MFRQDGSCPALLKDRDPGFPYGAVTRYGPPFQTLPVPKITATGLVRFRSPLLTESRLMSFPPATEMFQFAGFASAPYEFRCGYPLGWVAPFGDPGINDRSHLPRAFRSVPRPSSPLSAKASTRCPYFALERHTQRQKPSRYQNRYRRSEPTGATDPPSPGKTAADASVPPLRRHFVRDRRHAAHRTSPYKAWPGAARAAKLRFTGSRYGHTTRFFTIVNQQHAPAANRPPKAIPNSSPRYAPVALP
jgi:hypothetical protein